jgi:hypothetical protein
METGMMLNRIIRKFNGNLILNSKNLRKNAKQKSGTMKKGFLF